ncbi:MAG: NAD(P)H-dependent glycerol-3-phosphate dehydrogenase [Pseudomonadota bacterium]
MTGAVNGQLAVFGAGAFGTALAIALAERFEQVALVARGEAVADQLQVARANEKYLPGITLPNNITVTAQLVPCDLVLWAVPAQTTAQTLTERAGDLVDSGTVVICAKGLDLASGRRLSVVANGAAPNSKIAFLSGPGFAADIAAGLPTAMTIAARTGSLDLAQRLSTSRLRLYGSDDVTGVELGGALKNVVAIAAGIAMGAGYGESARAALVTRGFAEICRIAGAMGAKPETLMGLSGFGDLMLTASSTQSRNVAYGMAIGAGKKLPDRLAEGAKTASVAYTLAADLSVDTPVMAQTVALIEGRISVADAMDELLARDVRSE